MARVSGIDNAGQHVVIAKSLRPFAYCEKCGKEGIDVLLRNEKCRSGGVPDQL